MQRRVADLTKAGSIRPWHTRAKPLHQEGAAANIGNVGSAAAAGVSSALAAKQAHQEIKFAQARREEERRINNATEAKIKSDNHVNESNAYYSTFCATTQ